MIFLPKKRARELKKQLLEESQIRLDKSMKKSLDEYDKLNPIE